LKQKGSKLENGIRVETKDNLKEFLFAILEDNDNNQRMNGLSDENLIELYSCSSEALIQKERVSLSILNDLFKIDSYLLWFRMENCFIDL
jgi:hypothetical protein